MTISLTISGNNILFPKFSIKRDVLTCSYFVAKKALELFQELTSRVTNILSGSQTNQAYVEAETEPQLAKLRV